MHNLKIVIVRDGLRGGNLEKESIFIYIVSISNHTCRILYIYIYIYGKNIS